MNGKADIVLEKRFSDGTLAGTMTQFPVCRSEMDRHIVRPYFDPMLSVHAPHEVFFVVGQNTKDVKDMLAIRQDCKRANFADPPRILRSNFDATLIHGVELAQLN